LLDEIDPFVRIELRDGRLRGTATLDNEVGAGHDVAQPRTPRLSLAPRSFVFVLQVNPVWKDEEFDMLVDDMDTQMLTVELYDDNELTAPGLVGAVRIGMRDIGSLLQAAEASGPLRVLVPMFAPQSSSKKRSKRKSSYEVLTGEELRQAKHAAFVEDIVKEEVLKRPQAKLLIPYLMRKRAAKNARRAAMKEVAQRMAREDGREGVAMGGMVGKGVASAASAVTGVGAFATTTLRKMALGERSVVGHVCLELSIIPLARGDGDARAPVSGAAGDVASDVAGDAVNKNNSSSNTVNPANLLKRMVTFSSVASLADASGILSVHIIKATQLSATAATYVELVFQEQGMGNSSRSSRKRISMTTPHEYDPNPKFDYRADLNVKAGSILTLSVYELGSNLLRRVKRRRIGYAVINVMDVAELGGY